MKKAKVVAKKAKKLVLILKKKKATLPKKAVKQIKKQIRVLRTQSSKMKKSAIKTIKSKKGITIVTQYTVAVRTVVTVVRVVRKVVHTQKVFYTKKYCKSATGKLAVKPSKGKVMKARNLPKKVAKKVKAAARKIKVKKTLKKDPYWHYLLVYVTKNTKKTKKM